MIPIQMKKETNNADNRNDDQRKYDQHEPPKTNGDGTNHSFSRSVNNTTSSISTPALSAYDSKSCTNSADSAITKERTNGGENSSEKNLRQQGNVNLHLQQSSLQQSPTTSTSWTQPQLNNNPNQLKQADSFAALSAFNTTSTTPVHLTTFDGKSDNDTKTINEYPQRRKSPPPMNPVLHHKKSTKNDTTDTTPATGSSNGPSRNRTSRRTVQPISSDILCGKDKKYGMNPGNRAFRLHILSALDEYKRASKPGRMVITKKIVHDLQQQGSRFLRPIVIPSSSLSKNHSRSKSLVDRPSDDPKESASGSSNTTYVIQWEELTDQQARDKTSHALRFALLKPTERITNSKTTISAASGSSMDTCIFSGTENENEAINIDTKEPLSPSNENYYGSNNKETTDAKISSNSRPPASSPLMQLASILTEISTHTTDMTITNSATATTGKVEEKIPNKKKSKLSKNIMKRVMNQTYDSTIQTSSTSLPSQNAQTNEQHNQEQTQPQINSTNLPLYNNWNSKTDSLESTNPLHFASATTNNSTTTQVNLSLSSNLTNCQAESRTKQDFTSLTKVHPSCGFFIYSNGNAKSDYATNLILDDRNDDDKDLSCQNSTVLQQSKSTNFPGGAISGIDDPSHASNHTMAISRASAQANNYLDRPTQYDSDLRVVTFCSSEQREKNQTDVDKSVRPAVPSSQVFNLPSQVSHANKPSSFIHQQQHAINIPLNFIICVVHPKPIPNIAKLQ